MNRIAMIKIKSLFLCLVTAMCVSGCDFSETCSYMGRVEVILDWDGLWQHLQKTDELTAVFYKEDGSFTGYTVDRGVALAGIPSGSSRLLVYNETPGVELKETTAAYPELRQPTTYSGTQLTVEECPMICVATDELDVPVDETVYQLVKPAPIVKKLIFTVNVSGSGALGKLVSGEAFLTGIRTGYSITNKAPTDSSAMLFFPLKKGTDGKLSHNFYVLGVNPASGCVLNLSVTCEKGDVRMDGLDLGKVFGSFTQDVLRCEIAVDASVSPARVSLAKVEQSTY